MKQSNFFIAFLCTVNVLLVVVLGIQTTYMVWLHRQLYQAVAGTGNGLGDLSKLLNADIGDLTDRAGKQREKPAGPASPEGKKQADSLLHQDLGSLQNLGSLKGMLGDSLNDPQVRDLLKDLQMDDLLDRTQGQVQPPQAPQPQAETFRPTFEFNETPDGYEVTVDVPGVNESELFATVESGALKVSGTRDGRSFSESFAFPGPVQKGSERIAFADGKLRVTVRKG